MSAPVVVAAAPASRVGKAGFAIGIAIVGVIALAALFGNALIPQDPFVQDLGNRLKPPFWMEGTQPEHLLGTDQLGRDYLARLVYGARISLLIGIMTVITSGLIGITLGVLGGFFGGRIDDVVLFAITDAAVDPGGAGRARGGRADGLGPGARRRDARAAAVGPLRRGGARHHHAGAHSRLRQCRVVRAAPRRRTS